jgi:uncharacterized membrane protein YdjX (TVP38/TMEM64 family)
VAHAYAGILGPLAMLITVARGLLYGQAAEAVLLTAWCSLLAFAAAGYLVGWMAQRIVDEAVGGRIASELPSHESSPAADAARGT